MHQRCDKYLPAMNLRAFDDAIRNLLTGGVSALGDDFHRISGILDRGFEQGARRRSIRPKFVDPAIRIFVNRHLVQRKRNVRHLD